jgi:hypothetical protein
VLGRPEPCKFRGIIETCFGTFPRANNKKTCDNPACKKELRALTHKPANLKWVKANRDAINARRRKNYPLKKDRRNDLRRQSTAANRKEKPCAMYGVVKTCRGTFFPKGKQRTCSPECSKALAAKGQARRTGKYYAANRAKLNAKRRDRKKRAALREPKQSSLAL